MEKLIEPIMEHILSFIIFIPTLAGILLLLLPGGRRFQRNFAFIASLLNFFLSLLMLPPVLKCCERPVFKDTWGIQFAEKIEWIESLGISYYVGIDGISLWLVILTTFLTPIAILSTYRAIEERVKEFMFAFLLLETGMVGTFLSVDLFLFYIFWELMLIPMYLIIGVWGGPRRVYAAVKFFIYTMFGSVLMLLCILYLVFKYHELTGIWSFNLFDIKKLLLPASIQLWLFLGFGLAFAIKVPMFPFHTWLPDAHVEAPTAGSVILAAVLLKMGTYGFIRFAMPLFPIATEMFAPFIGGIAICGIIYGACVAWMQQDIKSLVAYSSVSHLGFVMLGLFAMNERGIMGAIYQMLNHGISTGGLFLLVGVLYERRHTRLIDEFGGLAAQMPRYATIFMIITLSSVGLPGLNNFIGEFLVLIGSFHSTFFSYPKLFTMLATIGIILGAVYMLWMYLKVFFGPLKKPENQVLKDLSLREGFVLVPIVILIFVMGFFPNIFLKRMEPSVKQFLVQYKAKIEQSYKYEKEIAENPELKSKAKLMEPPEIVILPLDEPEVHLPIKIKK